ncbi:MAG: RNA polymerase sigma factor, partial [Rhodospirillales bacterium]|nr:RNA polymerase sigma factor [Rhodospirillales bacterium]
DGFEGRSSLTTWIYSILVNKARTRGVRDARTVSFSELTTEEGNIPAVDPSRFDSAGMWSDPPRIWDSLNPERIVAGKQLCVHLAQIVDKLPPMQRAVITLQDIEDQDASVVCTLLQLTDANRRVLLHRARSKVRDELEAILGRSR